MSEYSPKPKAGYTKTGKSLKAVRRYYALKNADRQPRSPKKSREDDDNKKRSRRSPADDKLSKRIAAELRFQADANEKRSRRSPHLNDGLPASPPIIMSPKDTGPVFITEQPNKSVKSAKSFKSYKSAKSQKSVTTFAQGFDYQGTSIEFGPLSLGCVLGAGLIGAVYVLNWIFVHIYKALNDREMLNKNDSITTDGLRVALYLGIVSIVVILDALYWLNFRFGFNHAVISLILMMISTLCVGAYLIYTSVTKVHQSRQSTSTGQQYTSLNSRIERDNLIFLLAISYLVLLLISSGMMVKQVMSLRSPRQNDTKKTRTNEAQVPQMSHFLAPH